MNARPGSFVASAKVTSLMLIPAIPRTSLEVKPSTDPLPYLMANSDPFALYVSESEESYFL